jgi:3-hydroxyacyl-[acyl-carrier-protein] dehydratase
MTEAAHETGDQLDDLDIVAIEKILPHRYPFLLIDRLTEIRAFQSAVGIKAVTFNEPFFPGHFPGMPIMPGVLIIEALAQTAAALGMYSMGEAASGKPVLFMGVDEARFKRPVVPGELLHLHVELERRRMGVWRFAVEAKVNDKTVTAGRITAKIAD